MDNSERNRQDNHKRCYDWATVFLRDDDWRQSIMKREEMEQRGAYRGTKATKEERVFCLRARRGHAVRGPWGQSAWSPGDDGD